MFYEVFPFGKYKGLKIEEIPSTYLIFALEKFELPNELESHIHFVILGRLKTFSVLRNMIVNTSKSQVLDDLKNLKKCYER